MKVFLLLVSLLLILGLGVPYPIINWYRTNQLTSSLMLADDASTPDAKAKYLRQFVGDVQAAGLPTYAAFLNRTERTSVKAQIDILNTLIQRCDETAALDRSSFGYAQGMTQITGQEFDHTMAQTRALFSDAITVQMGLPWLTGCILGWLIGGVGLLVSSVLWLEM